MNTTQSLDPANAVVALVDIQKNHYSTVFDGDARLDKAVRFIKATRILDVPVVWTEHYPRVFGPTLRPLADVLWRLTPIPKLAFGCFGEPAFEKAIQEHGRGVLYLLGTETHICILQTGLQALERGMGVVVMTDCVTARGRNDHDMAIERLKAAGALLGTWESVVYEWMKGGDHPMFKRILSLVKGVR